MKLPEIKSNNKVRDTLICLLYLEGNSQEEIARDKRVNLSQMQISRILYKHRHVLILDKQYEKIKRINWLKKQLSKRGDSKKDSADLQEQIRNEIEGLQITGIPGVNINVSPTRTYVFTSNTEEVAGSVRGVFDSESQNRITNTEPQV